MTGTLSSTPSPAAPDRPDAAAVRRTPMGAVLASVAVVEIVSGSLQTFLGPIFSSLSDSLNVTAAQLNWVSIANLLAGAAFAPVLSRLGDLYGHRRVLRWNLAIMMLGSLLVALGRSFELLLAGQALQGSLTGLFPLLVGILRNHSSADDNRHGIGIMAAALGLGAGLGLVASGLIVEYASSPTAALWVPVFMVGVAVGLAQFVLPETDDRPGGRVDWAGGGLLGAGLVGVLLALSQGPDWGWTQAGTLTALIGGLVLLAAFVAVELRHPEPMVNVRMFADRQVNVISCVALAFPFSVFGLLVANAIFLSLPADTFGFGLGLSALNVSFAMLVAIGVAAVGSFCARFIAKALGDRSALVIGCTLIAAAYAWTALFHASLAEFLVGQAVAGFGVGMLQQVTRTIAVEAVPKEETAVGSGVNELVITVGGSLGAAVVGAVFTAHTAEGAYVPDEAGFTLSWWIAAGVPAAAALVALAYRAPHAKEDSR
ncbi:MFS transporter [Yinghuangia aomiensis]|uniref:MFS transporter n=1 Tax=Yinghuangia aomiensis TaxID=676205 RepID=A0ABP9I4B7_9ACTN